MGINYSKVMCADTVKKCAYITPIPYKIYSHNVAGMTPQQIQTYACGNKSGQIIQCCDPYDPAANNIVNDGSLLKIIRDNKGNYSEFLLCQCNNKTATNNMSLAECQDTYCKDFKPPTQYERCRARPVDRADEIKVNDHVVKVVAANTFGNCYQNCDFTK